MELTFAGKTVLVAGGTGGLGRAVTLAYLDHAANVIVTYRHHEEFASIERDAEGKSGTLFGFAVDVTESAATVALVSDILSRFSSLDVFVNCIGGYAGGTKAWQLDEETWDRMLDLNLRSNSSLIRAVVPPMLRQHAGAIVLVNAKAALDHGAGAAAYSASKAAALAMAGSLAADLKGTGVRVNSILPSIIDTPANREAMPRANFAEWPKPEDLASVILFLSSDAARVIHGAAIPVYGNS
ncbi:MAG: SDR family NAD(P)-dependent oxidoreductase [Acidobacteria bacterium]|nr:SDR family NAD(P)-dependent oxidoreductase [Acidobacteriota bacterium]